LRYVKAGSMSDCYILTGKYGDLLNCLPILSDRFNRTGEKTCVMVSTDYISFARELPYLIPVEFKGPVGAVDIAIKQAKIAGYRTIPLQVHADSFQVRHKHHSFAIDQWDRAGMADKWGTLPLVPPHREPRTAVQPHILFADHSQSSPFFRRHELYSLLCENFPNHKIIRLSGHKVDSLWDLIPMYNAADLLVTVETAHMHLSAAATCPVIALATDLPSPWHGTAQRPGLAFHCRYSDFDFRKDELIRAAKAAVNKTAITKPEIFTTAHENGYNLSMIRGVYNELIYAYRYHPDSRGWKTKLAIVSHGTTVTLNVPDSLREFSLEDGRLFHFNGKVHLAFTASADQGGFFKCVQCYGELIRTSDGWAIDKYFIPNAAGNDWSGMQKNYVPFVANGALHFIYGIVGGEQVVIQVEGAKVVKQHRSKDPVWKWGEIRGGCVVGDIRFFHSRVGSGHQHYKFRYYIGAAKMQMVAPFATETASKFPIMAGNEEWTPNCPHWKPNCCLPYGAVRNGDGFTISGGLNDCKSFTLDLKREDLNL